MIPSDVVAVAELFHQASSLVENLVCVNGPEKGVIPIPHCAICARDAREILSFEAILALIDAMRLAEALQTTARVAQMLTALPAAYRQQLVNEDAVGQLNNL